MTPTVGWSEADYYRAREAARRAFDRTSSQLQLGLESGEVARADSACLGCGLPRLEPALPHSPLGAGSPAKQSNGGAAPVPSDERGIPEEGA